MNIYNLEVQGEVIHADRRAYTASASMADSSVGLP